MTPSRSIRYHSIPISVELGTSVLCRVRFSRRTMTRRSLLAYLTASGMAAQKDPKVSKDDLYKIPSNLPVPVDDGACKHRPGMRVPASALVSTANGRLNMADVARDRTIIYCCPPSGRPDQDIPKGWNEIP